MDQRIYIPTTFTSEHLEGLMDIFHPVLKNTETVEVVLDFSKCKFLGHHAVTVIGGLAYWLREKMASSLTLDTTTLEAKIYQNLDQNGFLKHLGQGSEPWDGNSIPFRHDHKFQKDELIQYLGSKWLGKDWIRISNELKTILRTDHRYSLLSPRLKPHPGPLLAKEREIFWWLKWLGLNGDEPMEQRKICPLSLARRGLG
jgi:hypothetical protein